MTDTTTIDVLCQRMIEDMTARKLGPASQKSRLPACKRFAAWLQRSPDTATADAMNTRRFMQSTPIVHWAASSSPLWWQRSRSRLRSTWGQPLLIAKAIG
jgi:hypothetical protein